MKLLIDFIFVIGIASTFLILYRLFSAKPRQLPHILLIGIFTLVLVIITNFYADLHTIKLLYNLSYIIEDGSRLLIAPLIFLYIKSLFVKQEGFFKRNSIHIIPYLLFLFIFSLPVALTYMDVNYHFTHLTILELTYNLTFFKDVFFLFYCFLSIRLFMNYRNKMKSSYSTFGENDFGWVKQVLVASIILITIDILVLILDMIFDFPNAETGYITAIFMIFVIVYLGYYGVRQTTIFLPEFLILDTTANTGKNKLRQHSILTDEEASELRTKLIKILNDDKLYLDEDLTLLKLAKELQSTDKKVSYFLNKHMNVTFYELINRYRVEAVKEKLGIEEFRKYSLLGVAFSCGFKSKSSFYRIFKKETGISPAEFKNKIGKVE